MNNWTNVEIKLPEDVEDKEVKFEDGTAGIGYLAPGGAWCGGMPIPFEKKVTHWREHGGFDSLESEINRYQKGKIK